MLAGVSKPEELPKEEPKPWVLQVDGSTTKEASRAGLILTSPKGQRLSYALRFEFKATNNEAEYEALVVGLELASAVGASHVLTKSDSQLVVGQVLGEYTVKEEVMQKYLDRGKAQIAKLQGFNIVRIPRKENNEADYLAKLDMAKEDAIGRNASARYLELPSIFASDIQVIDHQENQEDLRAELDLLEETRETSMAKVDIYQQRMVKYHEVQVRPRSFRAGDLILRQNLSHWKEGGQARLKLGRPLSEREELPKEEPKPWVLQVDGSTTREESKAGLILTSPKGQRLSYALRFEFKATNNEVEYEALVVGLELANAIGASHVLAKSDSQLVIGQVLGEYTMKEEVMQKYLDNMKAQIAKLQGFNIVRIPREENNEADYLAKLATTKEDAIPRNAPMTGSKLSSLRLELQNT
ncbi:hypothetical protein RHSIM_Rhsim11G0031200 [Rhododendron simsii]|uniref:RNase H type-1 domain-containing protein n=1 Tax=Rhododendron simsii TaxID=118357 RepID=A0A834G7Y9_RHOSS|nr:hypothetical protein RHSIM_Rhsim11G0031200 [Rhododendron simsii]